VLCAANAARSNIQEHNVLRGDTACIFMLFLLSSAVLRGIGQTTFRSLDAFLISAHVLSNSDSSWIVRM